MCRPFWIRYVFELESGCHKHNAKINQHWQIMNDSNRATTTKIKIKCAIHLCTCNCYIISPLPLFIFIAFVSICLNIIFTTYSTNPDFLYVLYWQAQMDNGRFVLSFLYVFLSPFLFFLLFERNYIHVRTTIVLWTTETFLIVFRFVMSCGPYYFAHLCETTLMMLT